MKLPTRLLLLAGLSLGLAVCVPPAPAFHAASRDAVRPGPAAWIAVPVYESRTVSSWSDVRDWWPAADFHVRFRFPRGRRFHFRCASPAAARTLAAAGMSIEDHGRWTTVALTAGLHARSAGGYFWPNVDGWASELTVVISRHSDG